MKKATILTPIRLGWLIFLPLLLFFKFPLRIFIYELVWDVVFYTVLTVVCAVAAYTFHRAYQRRARWLVGLILLCMMLSSWQVFDLGFLRIHEQEDEGRVTIIRWAEDHMFGEYYLGYAWYPTRFLTYQNLPSQETCYDFYTEQLVGRPDIAFVISFRAMPWFACGA